MNQIRENRGKFTRFSVLRVHFSYFLQKKTELIKYIISKLEI